jgi:hypothetical protein
VESREKIIKAFTSVLKKKPDFKIMSNRFPIKVKFTSTDDDMKDAGMGIGVTTEAIRMYWEAIDECKAFDNKVPENSKIKVGSFTFKLMTQACKVKPFHWRALGVLINNCILKKIPFKINKPKHFFKWLDQGKKEFQKI